MTMSGKSALRKKRLKEREPRLDRRVASSSSAPERRRMRIPLGALLRLSRQLVPENADERQVAVPLREVQAVPDHEPVGDLEPDVAAVDVDLAALRLRQERADLERGRLPGLEVAEQVGERQARVDDVLDDEDVPALDGDVEVLEDANDAGGVDARPVARDGHEVHLAGDLDPP